jgi:hypothetical protein
MSDLSPDVSKAKRSVKATASPDEDWPRDGDDHSNTNSAQSSLANRVIQNEKAAHARICLCQRFMVITDFYLESALYQQHRAANNPNGTRDRETAKGMKEQWYQHLLENEGRTGLNEVLKDCFLNEAKEQLQFLGLVNTIEPAEGARAARRQVLGLIEECKVQKQKVDAVMGNFKY